MTLQQIIVGTVVYAVALAAIVYFTRPTWRRLAGAFVGGAAATGLGLWVIIPVGEAQRLCHVPLDPSPVLMALLFFGTSVSTAPILLVTWRIARRFGWRGLAVNRVGGANRISQLATRIPPTTRSATWTRSSPDWGWGQSPLSRTTPRVRQPLTGHLPTPSAWPGWCC